MACNRYGPHFTAIVAESALWVNGEQSSPDTLVGPADEVAIIPAFSGG